MRIQLGSSRDMSRGYPPSRSQRTDTTWRLATPMKMGMSVFGIYESCRKSSACLSCPKVSPGSTRFSLTPAGASCWPAVRLACLFMVRSSNGEVYAAFLVAQFGRRRLDPLPVGLQQVAQAINSLSMGCNSRCTNVSVFLSTIPYCHCTRTSAMFLAFFARTTPSVAL